MAVTRVFEVSWFIDSGGSDHGTEVDSLDEVLAIARRKLDSGKAYASVTIYRRERELVDLKEKP